MAICSRCGEEFDLTYAKKSMGKMYGAGIYDDYYPNGDVCRACALQEIGADYATGAELMDLMGDRWDDD